MDSNFIKIESGNEMDNDTEPKTRHSTSATEPREVDKPLERMRQIFEKHQVTQLDRPEK